jgi:hypothetical protein
MQKRVVRLVVLALLLATGGIAGFVTWNIVRETRALSDAGQDVAGRLDQLRTTVSDIAFAQHAYTAPGQPTQPAVERAATLVQRVDSDIQDVRPKLRSIEAAELLTVLSGATASLVEADTSARTHLGSNQDLWAAEIVFGQANELIATMTQSVRALQAAEARAVSTEQAALSQQMWTGIAVAAGLWTLGLLAMAYVPRVESPPVPVLTPTAIPEPEAGAPGTASLDLAAAADVCAGLSQLTSAQGLPDLLARTAAVLDASGIIVWMGAGEELLAAASHGYTPRVMSRFGAIARAADNPTSSAWRTGEIHFVAGDMMSNGAIVAPMLGPGSCIGVLAAEVRHGREADPGTRAVTAMIAAQLAVAVSAWPAASTVAAAEAEPETQSLREASGL